MATFSQKEDRRDEMDTGGQRLLIRGALVATRHQAAMIERSSFMAKAVQNLCR
ncbi:hypothetical protein D3C72_639600 [compost metagenome]